MRSGLRPIRFGRAYMTLLDFVLSRCTRGYDMSASPGVPHQQLPLRRWIGGFLLLLASIWLFLLVRDFYISVLARDATAIHAETFWRLGSLISAISIVVGLGVGWLLFRPGRAIQKEFGHHHTRHRREHPLAEVVTNDGSRPVEDDAVSYAVPVGVQDSPLSVESNGEANGAAPTRVKIRVKRRVRQRIRKKTE